MLCDFKGEKIDLIVAIGCNEDIISCGKCKKNVQIFFDLPDIEVGYELKLTTGEEDYFG